MKIEISTDVKMATAKAMGSEAYNNQRAVYKDRKRPELRTFLSFAFTACDTYVKHGNIAPLNDVIMAGRATGRMKVGKRVLEVAAGHKFDTAKGSYAGKKNKGVFNRNTRDGWQDRVREAMQLALDADAKTSDGSASEFDAEKRIMNTIKACFKNDEKMTDAQFKALVAKGLEARRLENKAKLQAVA